MPGNALLYTHVRAGPYVSHNCFVVYACALTVHCIMSLQCPCIVFPQHACMTGLVFCLPVFYRTKFGAWKFSTVYACARRTICITQHAFVYTHVCSLSTHGTPVPMPMHSISTACVHDVFGVPDVYLTKLCARKISTVYACARRTICITQHALLYTHVRSRSIVSWHSSTIA